jgi:hypothetical protein
MVEELPEKRGKSKPDQRIIRPGGNSQVAAVAR